MTSPFWQVVIIFLFAVLNGLLAMSEIAIISARKARLRQAAESGNKRAGAALHLASAPTDFLSTVQIGITLIGILAGAFGQATLAHAIANGIAKIAALAPYAEPISIVSVVIGVTYISLVIGELVPKRLALAHASKSLPMSLHR